MHKRLIGAGTALTLAVTFGAFGATGIALAGEPTTVTQTVPVPTVETQTVPVPGPTETVTVPGPTKTVTTPAKTKTVTQTVESGSSSGSGSSSISHAAASTTPVANTAAVHGTSADTGTVPVGGVQAGAGGATAQGPSPVLMSLALGMAALGLVSGGVALRRRFGEH